MAGFPDAPPSEKKSRKGLVAIIALVVVVLLAASAADMLATWSTVPDPADETPAALPPTPPVAGSMICANFVLPTDQTTGHGGVCAWANQAALMTMTTFDRGVGDTIRYARRALPDIVHRD